MVNLQWKSLLSVDYVPKMATKCYFMASAVCTGPLKITVRDRMVWLQQITANILQ